MLIVTVCQDYGFEVPPVRWTTARARRGEKYSTGTTHWQDFTNEHTSVTIREGLYQHDAELVVLHELAHWTSPVWYHHTIKFWERAFDFYERYSPRLGFSMAYAVEREKGYKKGALKVIHERGYYAG